MFMDIHQALSHPLWLKKALANPKSFWGTWPLLTEREAARAALSAKSRDYYDVNDREDNPFSVWTGALNRGKNRFGVEAYDRNRAVFADDPDRYINASYVREGAGGRWWVAAEVCSFLYVSFIIPLPLMVYASGRPHLRKPYMPSSLCFYLQRIIFSKVHGYTPSSN